MCTLEEEMGGGPIACLVLVSSLKLRKERRTNRQGGGSGGVLDKGTHVYPQTGLMS